MEQQIINQEILEKLRQLQKDIELLKRNLIDEDIILTPDEEERIDEALVEYENGETISHEELKNLCS